MGKTLLPAIRVKYLDKLFIGQPGWSHSEVERRYRVTIFDDEQAGYVLEGTEDFIGRKQAKDWLKANDKPLWDIVGSQVGDDGLHSHHLSPNMDISKTKVLFVDPSGLYTYTAQAIGKEVERVYYFGPNSPGYRRSQLADIGRGLPEIIRVKGTNYLPYVDKTDWIVYPDVYHSDDARWLRSKGYRVLCSGEEIELEKVDFLDALENVGLPVPETELVTGVSELVSFLQHRKPKEWYLKTLHRGDLDTKRFEGNKQLLNWISQDLYPRVGKAVENIKFLVQKKIDSACECGYDGFAIGDRYTDNPIIGYEDKDARFLGKVFDKTPEILDRVNKCFSDFNKELGTRGHWSTEIRVTANGSPFFIDPTCYSDDTELLTDEGWKLFQDLNRSETICTLNQQTHQIEYHLPSAYIGYEYKGPMVHLTSPKRVSDLLVTPNHAVWGSYRTSSAPIKEYRADALPGKLLIPRTGKWIGCEPDNFVLPEYSKSWTSGRWAKIYKTHYDEPKIINMETWIKFLALYLSDGSSNQNQVQISQFDKIEAFREILEQLPFVIQQTTRGFQISSTQLRNYVKQFGTCSNKFIPNFIKQLSPRLINIFLDAYMLADGSVRKNKNISQRRIYTTSVQLANDMQELFLKAGSVADIMIAKVKGTPMTAAGKTYLRNYDGLIVTERPTFRNYWLEGQGTARSDKYIKEVQYSGMVYDIEVENHIIYVRRSGKPMWSGNCRIPSPPGGLFPKMYKNYPQALYQIACGLVPILIPAAKYGVEIILKSAFNETKEVCVEFPEEFSGNIMLKNHYRRDGNIYVVPNKNFGFFGSVVAWGNNWKDCTERAREIAKEVVCEDIDADTSPFDNVQESIEAGERYGIDFS